MNKNSKSIVIEKKLLLIKSYEFSELQRFLRKFELFKNRSKMVAIVPGDEQGQIKKILKVIVVGEMGTGKTSLIRQYVQGFFSEFYKTTIGVDFANKDIKWDERTTVSLQLWDIAGQERYGNMTHVYYQEACAAFVVFDVTRTASFDMVPVWKKDIDDKVFTASNQPIPCMLLGNKIDLCPHGVWSKNHKDMDQFVVEHNFVGFFETSARNGANIDEAAKTLVKYIMDNNIEPSSGKNDKTVDLVVNEDQSMNSSGGCCK
ncbi:Ras family protein [Tritrichomonas foetus]|uniref:Ras-related protein Rab n=1 Tax=Tritrichomonas foetus TaxID=1144522 RepID=A0A1J4KC38_9EUKA|nr:Ras family protein [Tritrichomonas foetus]|eukprot:OHT07260.1 Ras family protein [Tritrichomonas foetus]